MSQDFDWSSDLTLKFIKVLSTERALWDFSDSRSKMKHNVNEAWNRVSLRMNVPLEILKNKKKTLMSIWRPLFKKKMASIRSGVEEDKIFQPVWFAYGAMESFLGSVYDVDGTLNTEYSHVYEEPAGPSSPSADSQRSDDTSSSLTIKQEIQEIQEIQENQDNQEKYSACEQSSQTEILSANKRKRSSEFTFDESQQSLNYSYDPLQTSHGLWRDEQQRLERSRAAQREAEDECDIYAKLLAKKLRKYPGRMRDRIMFKIDGLLLDNPYPDDGSSPRSSLHSQPSYS